MKKLLPENYDESEAPLADTIQAILAVAFFTVWVADSFWLNWTTNYSNYVPNVTRTAIFFSLILVGGYLSWMAHKQIFGIVRQEAELVDYGVFRLSRHPMYLGIMIIYLGLAIYTFSLASFLAVIVIFLFYNYLASYEEKKLVEYFGDEYTNYMKKTRRWF